MAKRRIHELAKDLNIASKDLIAKFQEIGIDIKNHMSSVDEDSVRRLSGVGKPAVEPKKEPPPRREPERDKVPIRGEDAPARAKPPERPVTEARRPERPPEREAAPVAGAPGAGRDEKAQQTGEQAAKPPEARKPDQPGTPGQDAVYDRGHRRREGHRRNRNRSQGQAPYQGQYQRDNTQRDQYPRNQYQGQGYDNRAGQAGQAGQVRQGEQGRPDRPAPIRDGRETGLRREVGQEQGAAPHRRDQAEPYQGQQGQTGEARREPFPRREQRDPAGLPVRQPQAPVRDGTAMRPAQPIPRTDRPGTDQAGAQRRPPSDGQREYPPARDPRRQPQAAGQTSERPATDQQRPFRRGDRDGSFQPRPYDPNRPPSREGYSQNRQGYSQGQGARGPSGDPRRQGQGPYRDMPPRTDRQGQGPGRPAGPGGRPDFQRKDDAGRPAFPRRDAKPAFGKKDDKKPEQPSKDDRKQLYQKNEQMRQEKSREKKDGDKKESKQFLDKKGKLRGAKTRVPILVKKPEPDVELIRIPPLLTVKELAEQLKRSGADVVKTLIKMGVMATVNQEIDFETASRIAESYNVLVEEAVEVDLFEEAFMHDVEDASLKVERPPVVVVMGHVDHGKTSLLDAIRNTKVQAGEAGGITQHIGAYTVTINGRPITFLDTPGHEAFTAMRMRGAQVTDIAILVVAANDGVMPQTVEAINHAKAAGIDIMVAINKVDLPDANPDKVKQELTEFGLLVEEWGGETIAVPVSAKKREGIEHLLEMIIIMADMKELRANPEKPARGTIIEAQLDKGRGPVATVLIQDGTLNVGDTVVAGACFGHIRAMMDDKGKKVKKAGPSIPVEILGMADVPSSGDLFFVAKDDKQARMLSNSVIAKSRVDMIKTTPQKVSLDDLFQQIQAGSVKDLNLIIKADVHGSVEALRTSLEKLSNAEVRVRIIHGGVGAINESDVMLASASNAVIIGFNIRPEANAKSVADAEKVDIRLYRVIYNAIDDITAAMKGMLDPVFRENVIGHAEIRQLFKASGVGTIGGSYVTDGKIVRNAQVRIVRDGVVVHEGSLETLRRFKDDVREVGMGYECGLLFAKFNDIKENDMVEAFVMEEIPR